MRHGRIRRNDAGHEVVFVTRGHRASWQAAAWARIEHVVEHVGIDRSAGEAQGRFGEPIAELAALQHRKVRSLLGYAPRYNPLQAIQESIIWLMQQGVVRQGVDG